MDPAHKTRPASPRPKYFDLNPAHLPAAGLVSIFHRVSGLVLFFPILPALIYLLQSTLGSEEGYRHWHAFFAQPAAKVVMLAVVWAYAHHFFAGLRYLLLDVHIGVAKAPSRTSALAVFLLGVVTTLVVGWCLW